MEEAAAAAVTAVATVEPESQDEVFGKTFKYALSCHLHAHWRYAELPADTKANVQVFMHVA